MFSSSGGSSIAIFVFIFFVITFFAMVLWTVLGEKFNIILDTERKVRVFNRIMGFLLLFTGVYFIANKIIHLLG